MFVRIKKDSWIYLVIVAFVLSYFTPVGIKQIAAIRIVTSAYKIVFPMLICFIYFYERRKLDVFDLAIALIITLYVVSAFVNYWYRINTLNRAARILAFCYVMKLACLEKSVSIRQQMFAALADCFCILSLINFIDVVVYVTLNGFSESLIFFWTDDNKSIEYYLVALFFAYIKKIYINKDSILLYILYIIVPIHTMLLHVGMGIIVSIILIYYYLVYYFKGIEKALSLNFVLIFFGLIVLMLFLYFHSGLIEPIVDMFYNKYHNLNSRVWLWHYFIKRTMKTPFCGIGVLTDQIASRKHGIEFWVEIGNCHNLYIEAIYQAGFFNLLTTLFLIFLVLNRINKAEKRMKYIGIFLIIFLIEGMMELGYATLFLFLPTLYYLSSETFTMEKVTSQ